MKKITVHLGIRSYPIHIGVDIGCLGAYLKKQGFGQKVFVVTNPLVKKLYAARLTAGLTQAGFAAVAATIPDGEKYKTLATVACLYRVALRAGVDRATPVIALGGGVVGDTAGFFAATYLRGIPLIQVPTTLLAMVDSSVGGKTGVDLPEGKNLAGAFYQPAAVWIDTTVLSTLPRRQFSNGMAEVIKYGVIGDAAFFARLERVFVGGQARLSGRALEDMVHACCTAKASVVEQDEFERKSIREILNFGHTFGHAIETVTGYAAYLHGEGVAMGMVMAGNLAVRMNLFSPKDQARLKQLLSAAGLPTAPREKLPAGKLLAVMLRDKKNRSDRLRLVLPRKIGQVAVVSPLSAAAVRPVLLNR